MAAVARIGDSTFGTCPLGHPKKPWTGSGTIISGSGTTNADGIPVARIGDSVLPGCGHVSTIVSGSGTTNADGIPVARVGDSVAGPYSATITSGSGTTFAT